MASDQTTTIGLLKNRYNDNNIEKQFNTEATLFKRLKKSPKSPSGRGLFLNAHLQGNEQGQGSQNELEGLRNSNTQKTEQPRVLPTVFTHLIRLSGLNMAAAKGGDESFADTLTFQMENGMEDSYKELNAQVYRSGSGLLAKANGAVAAAAVVTVDNGVITHFRRGMLIDFYTEGTTTREEAAVEVLDADPGTNIVTLGRDITVTDNADIYRADVHENAPAEGKELLGLPIVTDDGTLSVTYLNLSRATFPAWDGITIDAAGVNISNDLLQRSISRSKIANGSRVASAIVSNTSQMRKYLDILTPLKRFKAMEKMDSGHEEVPTWNGKEWIEDTDCGFDDVYGLNFENLKRYEIRGLHWAEDDGRLLKWDNGFDAYVAYLKYYGNIASDRPNTNFRLAKLNEPLF